MSSLRGSADNPNAGIEKGKIYIDSDTHIYKVLGENGVIYEGKLPDNIDLSNLSSKPANSELKTQILDYTIKHQLSLPETKITHSPFKRDSV